MYWCLITSWDPPQNIHNNEWAKNHPTSGNGTVSMVTPKQHNFYNRGLEPPKNRYTTENDNVLMCATYVPCILPISKELAFFSPFIFGQKAQKE